MSIKPKILFVDDDSNLLAAFQRSYRNQFNFDIALGGEEALRLVQSSGPYAVVLADMNMPGLNGVEVLERVRRLSPGSIRMMLTGNADQETAASAVNRGAVFRFLNKPCPSDVLVPAIEAALKEYQLQNLERDLLEGTVSGSIRMMSEVLGMVAPEAMGRGQRLRDAATHFARWLKLEPVWEIEAGALLSPVGYSAIPPRILRKIASGETLTLTENSMIKRVPQIGHNLLADIPRLKNVAKIVLYQNQSYDGTGFPLDGCSGEALPIGSRILKILNDRMKLEVEGKSGQAAMNTMGDRTGVYDLELLEKSFLCMEKFLLSAVSPDRPVISSELADLRVGDVVVSNICGLDGSLMVGAGIQMTGLVIERLANFSRSGDIKGPFMIQRDGAVEAPKV